MANICWNELHATSRDTRNLEYIKEFLEQEFNTDVYNIDDDLVELSFESKWDFPKKVMEEMFENIPNKEDIFIRCLSVEYGCLYHALWICDEEGWCEV